MTKDIWLTTPILPLPCFILILVVVVCGVCVALLPEKVLQKKSAAIIWYLTRRPTPAVCAVRARGVLRHPQCVRVQGNAGGGGVCPCPGRCRGDSVRVSGAVPGGQGREEGASP